MRICILTDEDIQTYNPEKYFQNYDWDLATLQSPLLDFMQDLSSRKEYDAYLNIFEGFDEDETSNVELVQALEKLNLPFTGADSTFYNPTREQMQAVAQANGINFAKGFNAKTAHDLMQAKPLTFPLIVKHPNSYASTGLIPESKVNWFDELENQFKRMIKEFGSARVEEFIEGGEVSCLIADNPDDLSSPYAYMPAEVIFPENETFMHEEVKWFNWDTYITPLRNHDLIKPIQEVSKKMYLAMNGRGYARLDLRIRPNHELVILEINPNPGILYYGQDDRSTTDLPISWDQDGHDGFLDRIFRSAILRNKGK
jgi:D-alanine-D-alanine ligase